MAVFVSETAQRVRIADSMTQSDAVADGQPMAQL